MGGGLDNVQSLVVFFFDGSPKQIQLQTVLSSKLFIKSILCTRSLYLLFPYIRFQGLHREALHRLQLQIIISPIHHWWGVEGGDAPQPLDHGAQGLEDENACQNSTR